MGTGTGTDDVYEPTLWYYELLLFTAQSETGRKGISNDIENDNELLDGNTQETNDVSKSSCKDVLFYYYTFIIHHVTKYYC